MNDQTELLTNEILIAKFGRISASDDYDHPIIDAEREQASDIARELCRNGWRKSAIGAHPTIDQIRSMPKSERDNLLSEAAELASSEFYLTKEDQ